MLFFNFSYIGNVIMNIKGFFNTKLNMNRQSGSSICKTFGAKSIWIFSFVQLMQVYLILSVYIAADKKLCTDRVNRIVIETLPECETKNCGSFWLSLWYFEIMDISYGHHVNNCINDSNRLYDIEDDINYVENNYINVLYSVNYNEFDLWWQLYAVEYTFIDLLLIIFIIFTGDDVNYYEMGDNLDIYIRNTIF